MRARHPTPVHGLLAGLLVLVVFVSAAVAMAAGGPAAGTGTAGDQAVAAELDGGAVRAHGGRVAAVRDADDGGRRHAGGFGR